jgi:hypothetical protein
LRCATRRSPDDTDEAASVTFSGTASCVDCHPGETKAWRGSDHDLAMAEATEETVLGDFDDVTVEFHGVEWRFFRRDGGYWVATEGTAGTPGEFEVRYTFGHEPLQQYLVPFPGGRLQAMSAAWDSERGEWYHLYPNATSRRTTGSTGPATARTGTACALNATPPTW